MRKITLVWFLLATLFGGWQAASAQKMGGGLKPFMGEIKLVASNYCPRYTTLADGTMLQISQHNQLYSLLGTMYGGDGRTTFALPDLRGPAPRSANGQTLLYCIAVFGVFPPRD